MYVRWGMKELRRKVPSSYYLHLRPYPYSSSAALHKAASSCSTSSDPKNPRKSLLFSKPQPLSIPPESKLWHQEREFTGLSRLGLRILGYYNRKSILMRKARTLYSRISNVVENPSLYATFGLEKSFRTVYSMLILHMWLCLARTKGEQPDGRDFGEALYVLFMEDLEHRVTDAGVRMHFSKWMSELEKMFYGAVKVYDEAMKPESPKDALAHALWKNVFAEDDSPMPNGQEAAPVQNLAQYVRRETGCLALTDKEIIFSGNILFSADNSWKDEENSNDESTV